MKYLFFVAILSITIFSCNNQNKEKAIDNIKEKKKQESFFPVTSFLKGQLLILDSFPINPLLITTSKGKTDSIWLEKKSVRPLLNPFISNLIDSTNLIEYFSEMTFNDQTINSVTLTYDPITTLPNTLSIRNWSVYINPETGNVTKVYIVKEFNENNQRITQQLTWDTDKSAKINTLLNKPDGNIELLKEEKLIWRF